MVLLRIHWLLLLAGVVLPAASHGSSCPHQEITRCLSLLASEAPPQSEPRPLQPEDIGWLADSAEFREYHSALIDVLPEKTSRRRQYLVEAAATSNGERQVQIFIYLALYEFFSGYPDQATESLRHARALAPDETRLVMLEHFLKTSGPLMAAAIHQAGFTPALCRQADGAATESLKMLTGDPLKTLNRQIESLPDIQWRIAAWFLMARYMEALNPCLLQAGFYDYQVLETLQSLQSPQHLNSLAKDLLRLYRRYEKT